MAIIAKEPVGSACAAALAAAPTRLISAGTLSEALIVAGRRGVGAEMALLVDDTNLQVVNLTADDARAVADAYARWGKGVHPAGLNLADCFAYALARARRLPLLFVGNDFSRTDVEPALA